MLRTTVDRTLETEEILQFHEHRTVRAPITGCRKDQRVELVALAMGIVVSHEEHRPGVDAVGRQDACEQCFVERVVIQDVPKKHAVGELVCGHRVQNLDVEHFAIGPYVPELSCVETDLGLQPRGRSERDTKIESGRATQKGIVGKTDLVATVEAHVECDLAARVDTAGDGVTRLPKIDLSKTLHDAVDVGSDTDVAGELKIESTPGLFILEGALMVAIAP